MRIFVYGTLKRGFSNHDVLDGAKFISTATTIEKYPMVLAAEYFPYLINQKGYGKHVKGEVYEIDDELLQRLDVFEGYPDLYVRDFIGLDLGEIDITAIAYFAKNTFDYKSLEFLSEFND